MSDPLTNLDIEDVLSSIRRLVTEGDKTRESLRGNVGDVDVLSDKLVLTPAFRVARDSAPDEPEYAPLILGSEAKVSEELPRRVNLEATIAELEAAVTEQPDDWEPDGSEVKTAPTWSSSGFDEQDTKAEAVVEVHQEELDEHTLFSTQDAAGSADAADQTVHAWEDANVDSSAMDTLVASGFLQPDELDVLQAKPSVRIVDDEPPQATEPEPNPEPMQEIETESVSKLETFVATPRMPRPDQREPDFADEDEFGDEMVGGTALAADEDLDAALANGSMIDETVLREIVLQVVREELQGNLGEKITRNVRKMVRREIHRVISTQEFD